MQANARDGVAGAINSWVCAEFLPDILFAVFRASKVVIAVFQQVSASAAEFSFHIE